LPFPSKHTYKHLIYIPNTNLPTKYHQKTQYFFNTLLAPNPSNQHFPIGSIFTIPSIPITVTALTPSHCHFKHFNTPPVYHTNNQRTTSKTTAFTQFNYTSQHQYTTQTLITTYSPHHTPLPPLAYKPLLSLHSFCLYILLPIQLCYQSKNHQATPPTSLPSFNIYPQRFNNHFIPILSTYLIQLTASIQCIPNSHTTLPATNSTNLTA